MALKMKNECERCQRPLDATGEAYICTHECTFCRDCTFAMHCTCPNCQGELVRRPRRGAVVAAARSYRDVPAPA